MGKHEAAIRALHGDKEGYIQENDAHLMGSVKDSILWTTHNLYADYRKGLISMAINIPGFAFHKALKVHFH